MNILYNSRGDARDTESEKKVLSNKWKKKTLSGKKQGGRNFNGRRAGKLVKADSVFFVKPVARST